MRPQTNGMVERFNGRIEDVLQSHRFHSGEDLEQTLLRYVHLYNSQLPQSALKGRTPIAALKVWQRQKPELFRKRVYNHAGCDTYIGRGFPASRRMVSATRSTISLSNSLCRARCFCSQARRSLRVTPEATSFSASS